MIIIGENFLIFYYHNANENITCTCTALSHSKQLLNVHTRRVQDQNDANFIITIQVCIMCDNIVAMIHCYFRNGNTKYE